MFKLFIFACFLALAAASPKPGVLAPVAYSAAYTAPVAAAYTAPAYAAYPAYSAAYPAYSAAYPAYSAAYTAPVAYSAYPYASPYGAYYLRR